MRGRGRGTGTPFSLRTGAGHTSRISGELCIPVKKNNVVTVVVVDGDLAAGIPALNLGPNLLKRKSQ